jgi:hypothetical protein
MISRFFIDRPVFAAVLSIVVTLAGTIAVLAQPSAHAPADRAADGAGLVQHEHDRCACRSVRRAL